MASKMVALLAGSAVAGWVARADAQVSFGVNTSAGQTAISPLIYGVNQQVTSSMNSTFERLGGDRWTAYNYTNNASNAGNDYYYENDNYLGGGTTPGGAVLPYLQNAQSFGAGVLVTVPINGYVAADTDASHTATSTAPSGAPTSHFVPEYPTAASDPAPAANHVYQNGFVQLVKNAMASTPNAPVAFDLDNEPDLWRSTHPEVHPTAVTYAELLQRSTAYATMIKSVDPTAMVYGPVSYGWEGYQNLQNASDAGAHGNFINWYLKNMSAASATAGVRLLDVLDLHWYPEATGANASGVQTRITGDDNSAGVVAARLQAPRSLWDASYVENSWITDPATGSLGTGGKGIDLIPSMQSKIAANYPGTKLSFSEYNYGGGSSISGAIAEADVLGIFGKFGVYSANEWPSGSEPFIDAGFKMFRNYNGQGGSFGNIEVSAANSDTADTSIYASVDSSNPNHLTLVVINKESQSVTASLSLSGGINFSSGAVYQLTGGSANPVFFGNVAVAGNAFTYTMPADSVSMISLVGVPEPATLWLAAMGATATTLRHRRRSAV